LDFSIVSDLNVFVKVIYNALDLTINVVSLGPSRNVVFLVKFLCKFVNFRTKLVNFLFNLFGFGPFLNLLVNLLILDEFLELTVKVSKLSLYLLFLLFVNMNSCHHGSSVSNLNVFIKIIYDALDLTINVVFLGPSLDVVFLVKLLSKFINFISKLVNFLFNLFRFGPFLNLLVNIFILDKFLDFTVKVSKLSLYLLFLFFVNMNSC